MSILSLFNGTSGTKKVSGLPEAGGASVLEKLKSDLAAVRVGRANPALLLSLPVPYKSRSVPLSSLADVRVKDQQTLVVVLHDEELLPTVSKAIRNSSLGLNPLEDQKTLRVPVPRLTPETRSHLVQLITTHAERAKMALRGVRQDAREEIRRRNEAGQMDKDEKKRVEKMLEEMVGKWGKEVEGMVKVKVEAV
ncbi:hypothetical protein HDU93_000257 [Gonapodya sp. JEL0774]|nr:hypothetical protein HDU93_000257 [Gonapodya sp. JEL0774]